MTVSFSVRANKGANGESQGGWVALCSRTLYCTVHDVSKFARKILQSNSRKKTLAGLFKQRLLPRFPRRERDGKLLNVKIADKVQAEN